MELARAARRAGENLRQAMPLAALAGVILSLTLAVVGAVAAIAAQAGRLASSATPPEQVNLYLAAPLVGAARSQMLAAVEQMEGVERARYVGPEDALEELAAELPDVRSWIGALGENPLPATVVATVRSGLDPASPGAGSLTAAFAKLPDVTEVQVAAEAVSRVVPVLRSIRWTSAGVAAALVTAMLFVVVATFRLMLEPRRAEIEILRLNGATERWIRAPLWIEGALLGVVAGTASAALVGWWGASLGRIEIPAFVTGRADALALELVPGGVWLALVFLGPLLGVAGAAVATRWGLGRA